MSNYFDDNEDLRWYFDRGIDWAPLVELTERMRGGEEPRSTKDALDFYRDVLNLAGKFAADEIAPAAAAMDRKAVHLVDGEVVVSEETEAIFRRIAELDLHWLCLPRELGGMNAPLLVYFLVAELFARADVSTMTHHSFHGGMAMALLVFSLREGSTKINKDTFTIEETRFQQAIEEIGSGEAWGTMDITEPDAGSDMAALRTRAEQDEHGNWFVTGTKIFITSGHGKWHFVIARTEPAASEHDPFAGLQGLSFFLVPAYEDVPGEGRKRYATIGRVEEKLGHHGSVTAEIVFERSPAHLIGKRGEGFRYMLTLMNNARLGVGFECIGLCEAALRAASSYAQGRRSMGKTIDKHEMIADYLEEMDTDIVGLRALAVSGAIAEESYQKLQLWHDHAPPTDPKELAKLRRDLSVARAQARRLTPLLKYLGAEKAVEMARRAIQIHGGNGYMQEYGVEKLLRDALVMPIYEGTSQIQSLMVMKDALGDIIKRPQDFIANMAQARWRSMSSNSPLARRVARLEIVVLETLQLLVRRTAADKLRSLGDVPMTRWLTALRSDWNPKRDFAWAMLHAERLTKMLADLAICQLLLEQSERDATRGIYLERYLDRAEPRARFLQDEITTMGASLLKRLAGARQGHGPDVAAAQ